MKPEQFATKTAMHHACLFPVHRAVRQRTTQLITEALETAKARSASSFAFCVPFLVTRLQLLEMLNTLDFEGLAPAVYLHKAVLPCSRNRATVRPLKPGRTVPDQIFQYWLHDLDYSSMTAARWLSPTALPPHSMPEGRAQVDLWWCFHVEDTPGPSCHPTHPKEFTQELFRVTGKAFWSFSSSSAHPVCSSTLISSLTMFKRCCLCKLFSLYMLYLCSLKFLLLKEGICLVKKYKAEPVLHFVI